MRSLFAFFTATLVLVSSAFADSFEVPEHITLSHPLSAEQLEFARAELDFWLESLETEAANDSQGRKLMLEEMAAYALEAGGCVGDQGFFERRVLGSNFRDVRDFKEGLEILNQGDNYIHEKRWFDELYASESFVFDGFDSVLGGFDTLQSFATWECVVRFEKETYAAVQWFAWFVSNQESCLIKLPQPAYSNRIIRRGLARLQAIGLLEETGQSRLRFDACSLREVDADLNFQDIPYDDDRVLDLFWGEEQ